VVEKWRRLRGLGALNRRQLAIVRELYRWREEVAVRADRPPRTLCRDDLLVEIARRNPLRIRDLQVIRGLARRDLEAILAAVERARALPALECPLVIEREQDPPQVALLTNVLSAVLGHWCEEMRLAPGIVSSTQELRRLARAHVDGGAPQGTSSLDDGWRRESIRPLLEAILRGEQALRVVRPHAEAPFEFLPVRPEP
jgi:ribonuclease D